ncbi:MAG: DUF1573 domain-containing protein [Chitinophagaceae bacterium]|nr:DUF1573 domain-containing protein [Chitinophagaceae bacterium]
MKYILSLLFIVCTIGAIQAQNPNSPVMTFTSDTHDFGVVPEGPEALYDFEFTNTGKEPLVIRNCQGSCACTKADWVRTPIAPGQKGKITVKYKTEGYPGDFKKTVYIQSNAKPDRERIEIYIRGSVKPKETKASETDLKANVNEPKIEPSTDETKELKDTKK